MMILTNYNYVEQWYINIIIIHPKKIIEIINDKSFELEN